VRAVLTRSVGLLGGEGDEADLGFFCGSGVISPAFFRMRQIGASETVNWYCLAKCQAIVWARRRATLPGQLLARPDDQLDGGAGIAVG
jgi:hypothetical protein